MNGLSPCHISKYQNSQKSYKAPTTRKYIQWHNFFAIASSLSADLRSADYCCKTRRTLAPEETNKSLVSSCRKSSRSRLVTRIVWFSRACRILENNILVGIIIELNEKRSMFKPGIWFYGSNCAIWNLHWLGCLPPMIQTCV